VKLIIDMNLSPTWVEYFAQHGVETVHWSTVGDPRARDETIMDHARQEGMVVFTHDLDFGHRRSMGPRGSDRIFHEARGTMEETLRRVAGKPSIKGSPGAASQRRCLEKLPVHSGAV
jgi:hypothetical protein